MNLLSLSVLLALSSIPCQPAFGAATFVFRNWTPNGSIDAPVLDAGGNRLAGTDYVAVLLGGATMESLEIAQVGGSSMDPVPFTYAPLGQPGYFFRAGSVSISSAPDGGYAWLQVRAWDLRLGSTYEEVSSLGLGGYGQSSLFYARGGDPLGAPPSQPLLGLQSFSLVPEPGTWALMAVGAGVLFWKCNRRREMKQQQHTLC